MVFDLALARRNSRRCHKRSSTAHVLYTSLSCAGSFARAAADVGGTRRRRRRRGRLRGGVAHRHAHRVS